jgi:hypothetical protein
MRGRAQGIIFKLLSLERQNEKRRSQNTDQRSADNQ